MFSGISLILHSYQIWEVIIKLNSAGTVNYLHFNKKNQGMMGHIAIIHEVKKQFNVTFVMLTLDKSLISILLKYVSKKNIILELKQYWSL